MSTHSSRLQAHIARIQKELAADAEAREGIRAKNPKKTPLKVRPGRDQCASAWCERLAVSRGWCNGCYQRGLKAGLKKGETAAFPKPRGGHCGRSLNDAERRFLEAYAERDETIMGAIRKAKLKVSLLTAKKLLADNSRRDGLSTALKVRITSKFRAHWTGPPAYGLRGDRDEAEVVKRIYRQAGFGVGKRGAMKRIAEDLNADGFSSSRGGRWTKSSVAGILRSRRYFEVVGAVVWNRTQKALDGRNLRARK